jgi:hypothetical protein
MAPRAKNVKLAKNVNRWLRTVETDSSTFCCQETRPAIFLRFYIFLIKHLLKWHLSYIKIIRKIQGILFHKNLFSLLNIKKTNTRIMNNPSPETPPLSIHSLDSLNESKWGCSYISSGTETYELSN